MDELLPHYERELAALRAHAGDFARRYPKVASRLQLSGDVGEDPQVERLFQSFALLAARAHTRLDDDFPRFTEALLGTLYPHCLRPFPACSIVQVQYAASALAAGEVAVVPRGAMFESTPVRGVKCRFRTAFAVSLAPLRIAAVAFQRSLRAPEGCQVPGAAQALLSLRFEWQGGAPAWKTLPEAIRLHVDGEGGRVHALREALTGNVLAMFAQASAGDAWESCGDALPRPVGFAEDESLIDFDARAHPAYRVLTEYFGFPGKFDFVDVPVPAAMRRSASPFVTLHLALRGFPGESRAAQWLESVDVQNLRLGCTPVSNQFEATADPIEVTAGLARHPVLPVGGAAVGWEVLAIDRVHRVRDAAGRDAVVEEFEPLHCLRHAGAGDPATCYWLALRDEAVAAASPGRETALVLVDSRLQPLDVPIHGLAVDLRATNRDLPGELHPGDELTLEGGDPSRQVRLLRRPSRTGRFQRGQGALWRLVSQQSLNPLSLSGCGIDALREILSLHDLPRSRRNRRQLDGILAIEHGPAHAWMPGVPGVPAPSFVRGMEVRLSVDEEAFADTGLGLFAQVMDRFFALYVHAHSFTQLRVLSGRGQKLLMAFPPRRGDGPLV